MKTRDPRGPRALARRVALPCAGQRASIAAVRDLRAAAERRVRVQLGSATFAVSGSLDARRGGASYQLLDLHPGRTTSPAEQRRPRRPGASTRTTRSSTEYESSTYEARRDRGSSSVEPDVPPCVTVERQRRDQRVHPADLRSPTPVAARSCGLQGSTPTRVRTSRRPSSRSRCTVCQGCLGLPSCRGRGPDVTSARRLPVSGPIAVTREPSAARAARRAASRPKP